MGTQKCSGDILEKAGNGSPDLLLDRNNVVNHLNCVSGWRKRLWRASPATNKSNRGEDK